MLGCADQVPRTAVRAVVPSASGVPVIEGAVRLVGSLVTAAVNREFFFVILVRLTDCAKNHDVFAYVRVIQG